MNKNNFDFYDYTNLKSYNLDGQIRYQLKMLDELDVFTKIHSENVAAITCRLCEYLHLDKGFTVYCTTCAYLHDIGKIFIPPAILQKKGSLTEEEYNIIKTHTTIGYNMCMQDPQLKPYYAGPLYHHESLDGTGYPNGLKGNKIPYEGQIIRVADEFDAITSKRQYKTHIGIVDALKIMIEHAKPCDSDVLKSLKADYKFGKIDKKVLKALFKVVIDDIEYEITIKLNYLEKIKEEIKRLQKASIPYKKMIKSHKDSDKQFFHTEAKFYLHSNETVENIPNELNEYKIAYDKSIDHINKLYIEINQIKKLKV